MNAIINFATKFFEMFTKKQSRHPHQVFQVFQVFRVFQVFHVRFWTTKPPDFGPNPNKHVKPIGSSYRHIMATENTQKANSPTGLRTRYCPVCDSHSSFSAKRFFFGRRSGKARGETRHRRWHIVGNSMQAKSKPEAQLGDRRSQSDEPRRVGCGKSFRLHTGERQRFLRSSFSLLPIAAVFFRRSRLFVIFHPSKPRHPTQAPSLRTSPNQAVAIKNSRK